MAHSVKKPDMIIAPKRIQPARRLGPGKSNQGTSTDFEKYLQQEIQHRNEVRFSAHATRRLQSRQITLTENQRMKLSEALDQAKNKGIKDSLILMNRLALVVNVKNRTVVTAMDRSQMNGGMITNIDGAMIIQED